MTHSDEANLDAHKNDVRLFVSHVSEDRALAMAFISDLERRGVRCWIAPRDVRPGRPFDDEIADAIEASTALLLIFSGRCNDNQYIRREVTVAGDSAKLIIPLRVENAQPKKGLKVRLADLHWIEVGEGRQQAIDQILQTLVVQSSADAVPLKFRVPSHQEPSVIYAEDVATLLKAQSNSKIVTTFSSGIIGRVFPNVGPNAEWRIVHDGRELVFIDLSNFEISGRGQPSEILAEPRYAWVLNFRNSQSLALRGLTFGHTESGYCQGGVIRFESCTDVIIERCELYGSGTYGLEFVDCKNVEVLDCVVRNCTYGIANITRSTQINFSQCRLHDNEGFDLFVIRESGKVMIKRCIFSRNRSEGAMFHFGGLSSRHNFYVNECSFAENTYVSFTNEMACLIQNNNQFTNEHDSSKRSPQSP